MSNKRIPELILIRGLPGSGKTTYAINNFPWYFHYETDMFFENDRGDYIFDSSKLSEYHKKCFDKMVHAMNDIAAGLTRVWDGVTVANTFSRIWEMQKYIDFCKNNNYKFRVIRLNTQYGNVHNVPKNTILNMKNRFEKFIGEKEIY